MRTKVPRVQFRIIGYSSRRGDLLEILLSGTKLELFYCVSI